MKTAIALLASIQAGCATYPNKIDAEVVDIRQIQEQYQTGWWGVYTVVTYRVEKRNGEKTETKRIYGNDDPEIESLKPGMIVKIESQKKEKEPNQ